MITSNPFVSNLVQGAVIILAVIAVGVADVMLKRAAAHGSLLTALHSPWLFMAIGLYLFQIGFFTIAFIAGWKLSIIGALQTALYAIIVLAAGVFLYNEDLTRLQMFGILMAFSGVVMINWPK
jgi:drug/metabolite transporter (DMT)-like permease